MIVSAHQPHYLPWIGYLNKIYLSDIFVVVDNVQFVRNLISKNKVINNRGEFFLRVPVLGSKASFLNPINQIQISYNRVPNWIYKHLESIKHNYKKSTSFDEVIYNLEKIYCSQPLSLLELDMAIIQFLLEYLNIKTKIVYASDLNISGNKESDLMFDILLKTQSDSLLLGLGASTKYINVKAIKEKGYNLLFQDFNHPIYKQKCKIFTKGVSVLDLILSVNKHDAQELVKTCGSFNFV
jgi:hypothetical protein